MVKATRSLTSMSVDALLVMRDRVGAALHQKSRELQGQLERLEGVGSTKDRARAHPRKGIKVAPKYRGPNGETWAGRGATPTWLAALMKEGRKRDDFLIERPAKASAARRRSNNKRSSRKRRK
jgi:DNA-binding protein H-NS